MRAAALLLLLAALASAEDQLMGYTGHWVEAVATAYSPHDRLDAAYRATKGRDLHMTAGRVSDVRLVPYGVAAPQGVAGLSLPLRTRVIVPRGYGYLDRTPGHDADGPGRVFLVDDTGGAITARTRATGRMHLDLRYRTESSALSFNRTGRTDLRVFVITGLAPPEPATEPAAPARQRPVAGAAPPPFTLFPPPPAVTEDPMPWWSQLAAGVAVAGLLYLAARTLRHTRR